MPTITSHNPATEETFASFEELTDVQMEEKLASAQKAFTTWRLTSFAERSQLMKKAATLLRERKREYGEIMTKEMGKPITQAMKEAEKCAWVCEYYADEAEKMLAEEPVKTEGSESYVRFDPMGVLLAVMPWNFPFWQVFRFAAPALMAGNVGVLKHASNVPQCAEMIERIFIDAGFPTGVFQNMLIGSAKVESIIRDPRVKAVTLTGSGPAGASVASIAGEEIKKTVMELGSSDAFIILEDADLDAACSVAPMARLQNNGQSCIAAKRFIVVETIAEEFIKRFQASFEATVIGDPMDEKTDIGPVVNKKSQKEIHRQVTDSVAKGATLVTGGTIPDKKGYFYPPTILRNVAPGMPAYDEEIFGPVASVIVVKDADEAVKVANSIDYGLGASLWTKNMDEAKRLAGLIETGAVFVNGMVASDPRLPFGGVKKSGYGRELGEYGIKEFVNIKSVWIK